VWVDLLSLNSFIYFWSFKKLISWNYFTLVPERWFHWLPNPHLTVLSAFEKWHATSFWIP
jgi:hypothetical protein